MFGGALLLPAVLATAGVAVGSTAEAWLEKNAADPDVTVLTSGLQYSVIANGSGEKAGQQQELTFDYHATLVNGAVVDSPRTAQAEYLFPYVMTEGVKEALSLMRAGDRWKLFVPPGLAFGEHRDFPGQYVEVSEGVTYRQHEVPAGSVIIIDLELIEIRLEGEQKSSRTEAVKQERYRRLWREKWLGRFFSPHVYAMYMLLGSLVLAFFFRWIMESPPPPPSRTVPSSPKASKGKASKGKAIPVGSG